MKTMMRIAGMLFMFTLLSFLSVFLAPEAEDTLSRGFSLPSSLLVIEDEAFMGTGFEDVIIPEGIESIGVRAFADNSSMRTVKIPESVFAIGSDAFRGADGLVITGKSGSYAEKWAAAHHAAFLPENHTIVFRVKGSTEGHEAIDRGSAAIKAEAKERGHFRDSDQDSPVRLAEKAKMHPIELKFP